MVHSVCVNESNDWDNNDICKALRRYSVLSAIYVQRPDLLLLFWASLVFTNGAWLKTIQNAPQGVEKMHTFCAAIAGNPESDKQHYYLCWMLKDFKDVQSLYFLVYLSSSSTLSSSPSSSSASLSSSLSLSLCNIIYRCRDTRELPRSLGSTLFKLTSTSSETLQRIWCRLVNSTLAS